MQKFLVQAVCLAVLALPLAAGTALADYHVGFTHGTDKIRPEFDFTANDSYQIHAAQNEWEPFQVLVMDDAGLTNVDVTVSAFTGPGDDIDQIDLYRVHYVPVTAETISHEPPDPSKVGDWSDGLVPFVDHFVGESRDGAPFDVAAGYVQAVFVDVYVPDGQAAGDYTADVVVTADGHDQWNGTVTLTVWNFALPNEMAIDSNYGFSPSTVTNYHGNHGGVTPDEQLLAWYYLEFARHRMSLYNWRRFNPTCEWNDVTQTIDCDWTDFDAYHGPYFDGDFYKTGFKFTGMRFHGGPGGRPAHVTPEDWDREWWAVWAEHFRQKGWLDQTWYYLPDEPNPSQYPALIDLADRIHEGDPDLTVMVTEQFEEELAGHVDLWCPDEPLFSDSMLWPPYPEVYDERRALGEKTWWYNCVSATIGFDYANHMVDYPSSQMRIWLWLTRRYHFQGILFWSSIYQYIFKDPWQTQYIDNFLCQGDGTMIYPGVIEAIGGTTDIPVASLRMKYLRESMEDYEYFHLLDGQGDEEWVDDVTFTVAPKTYIWEHDWEVLLDWRRKVARKIMGTLDETPPAPPTDLAAAPGEHSATVTWTPPADSDLAGFDVWYAIYEGDRFWGGRAGAADAEIVLGSLIAGREHTIWLNAFDTDGNRSADSDIATVTPTGPAVDDDAADDDVADDDLDDDGPTDLQADGDDDDNPGGCGGRG